MKSTTLILFALILVACGRAEPPETVESLIANPKRLEELRGQCRLDRAKLGDALCNRVAEATTRRFLGNGTPYTPPKHVRGF